MSTTNENILGKSYEEKKETKNTINLDSSSKKNENIFINNNIMSDNTLIEKLKTQANSLGEIVEPSKVNTISAEKNSLDLAEDNNFTYNYNQELKAYLAITNPQSYLSRRLVEMSKLQAKVNTRAGEIYERERRKGKSKPLSKKIASDYASKILELEYNMLNDEYPINLTEIAQNKVVNKSMSELKPEYQ